MSGPAPFPQEEVRRRAEGSELWLLRAQRGSGLSPPLFGLLVGLLVAAVVGAAGLHPAIPARDLGSFAASGAFFGVSIGMICAIMPGVFSAAVRDTERLAPITQGTPEDLALLGRALVRMAPGHAARTGIVAALLGCAHGWLLGQWSLPLVPALLQTTGTVLMWIGMTACLAPLLMNAQLFASLGRQARPDLFRPELTAPFGSLALRPTLVIVGLQCAYPILFLGGDGSLAGATLLGVAAALASMTGMFFLPLRGIRQRLVALRRDTLVGLQERIEALDVVRRGIDAETDVDELRQLEQLLALRDRIAHASTWPLDIASARRVLIYVILPPLTWAAAALVEMGLDRAL